MPSIVHGSRRSIRLARYDYSQSGFYFFTICLLGHKSILGRILGYQMECTPAGNAVWGIWNTLPARFPAIELDTFIVMPNHVHGILFLRPPAKNMGGASPVPTRSTSARRGDPRVAPSGCPVRHNPGPLTLGQIIGAFKSLSAIAVNLVLHRTGPLWQRNYYEHIVRSPSDLDSIRLYISRNPAQWQNDRENPLARNPEPYPFKTFSGFE